MIKKKALQALLTAILTINVSACVSIPAEAPELSVELGKHLGRLEKANIALLNKFFSFKRQEINRFIETDWLPMFAQEVFAEPNFKNAWNQIINGADKADQLKFVIMLGPKLLKKMDKARSDMLEPLNELETAMEAQIRSEYSQTKAINNSLTSFLTSAAEVVESQNRYLAMAGLKDEAMLSTIQMADSIVSGALSNLEKANNYSLEITKYQQKLDELKNKLK